MNEFCNKILSLPLGVLDDEKQMPIAKATDVVPLDEDEFPVRTGALMNVEGYEDDTEWWEDAVVKLDANYVQLSSHGTNAWVHTEKATSILAPLDVTRAWLGPTVSSSVTPSVCVEVSAPRPISSSGVTGQVNDLLKAASLTLGSVALRYERLNTKRALLGQPSLVDDALPIK